MTFSSRLKMLILVLLILFTGSINGYNVTLSPDLLAGRLKEHQGANFVQFIRQQDIVESKPLNGVINFSFASAPTLTELFFSAPAVNAPSFPSGGLSFTARNIALASVAGTREIQGSFSLTLSFAGGPTISVPVRLNATLGTDNTVGGRIIGEVPADSPIGRATLLLTFFAVTRSDSVPDLTVSKLEVTQTIQYLNNTSQADNSITVIRGRTTVVRLYVGVAGAGSVVSGVDAKLRVLVEGSEMTGSPFNSVNGPIMARLAPNRDNTDDTLNFAFVIPTGAGTTSASVMLRVEVNPGQSVDESNYSNNMLEVPLTFACRKSPLITYTSIDYRPTAPSPSDPNLPPASLIMPGVGDQFVKGIYPVPDALDYSQAPFPPVTWPSDVNSGGNDAKLNNLLETCRQLITPRPDFLYGWLPGNPYTSNGLSNGIPGTVAFGNSQNSPDKFQRSFAHELGHLFGRCHPDDPAPACAGRRSPTLIGETGFDVKDYIPQDNCDTTDTGDGIPDVKCSTLNDIMAAGKLTKEAWVHPQTYTAFLSNAVVQCSSTLELGLDSFVNPDHFLVTGVLKLSTNQGSLAPIYRLSGDAQLTPPLAAGSQRLELRNAANSVLFGINFEVKPHNDGEGPPPDTGGFSLIVPAFDATASVVLLSRGTEVARITRSPNSPTITITSPSANATLGAQQLIQWVASDPDGGPLTFSVQYSPDNGQTFVPLVVNTTDNTFNLATSQIAGGTNALIRVLATDGLNTTTAEVRGLAVAKKAPTVLILSPGNQQRFLAGSNVIFTGYGFDFEDGFLPDNQLAWVSDRDGTLGSGRVLQTSRLSIGTHRITLTGRDRDGNTRSANITIVIFTRIVLKPDLVPVKQFPSDPSLQAFCKTVKRGTATLRDDRLVVTVKNQGSADAAGSTTKVEFFPGGPVSLPTPAIPAGGSVDLEFPLPSDFSRANSGDFRITVDSDNTVDESNEGNNSADGACKSIG